MTLLELTFALVFFSSLCNLVILILVCRIPTEPSIDLARLLMDLHDQSCYKDLLDIQKSGFEKDKP